MNTGPTPLSERDPYPFPQPEGDLQFRGKDDSKNYKDPHKIISRKEVICLRRGETIELKGPFMVLRHNSDEY